MLTVYILVLRSIVKNLSVQDRTWLGPLYRQSKGAWWQFHHMKTCAFQQVTKNVEESVGDVLLGQSGAQTGHILLETRDKGVWVDWIRAWREKFTWKPKGLAIDHLYWQNNQCPP